MKNQSSIDIEELTLQNLCLLCKNRLADKKNAHLIPHFLIKTATNENGSLLRDKELVFTLSSGDFFDVFYGRDISVKKIMETRGQDLSDKQISELENPFTRDELICISCEKKLSVLEGYIAQNIYNPLIEGKNMPFITDKLERKILMPNNISPTLYYLFVCSIFWRCSIGKFNNFKLQPNIEEILRQTLNTLLDLDIENMLINKEKNNYFFPIISTFGAKTENNDPTSNFVTTQSTRFPYFIIANNMTFQLFEKSKQVRASVQYLYGLSSMISREECCMFNESNVKIGILTPEQNNKLCQSVYDEIAHKANQFFFRLFNDGHKKIFGKDAPKKLLQIFFTKFLYMDIPLASRYTREFFMQCVYESYLEFGYR